MLKQWRMLVALVAVLAIVAAACGNDDGGATTTAAPTTTAAAETTTTAAPTTTAAAAPLVIWADEKRSAVLQTITADFTDATGVPVEIVTQDFGGIRELVQTAGPAGEGPDIFIGAHDWVGELATNGVLDTIDLGAKAADFSQPALDVFVFNGDLYGVPYATEAVALYYNKDLVPEAPATFDDLTAACDELTGLDNCLGVPGGGTQTDAYHHYPFISALGGYIFGSDNGVYDPTDVGIDSDGAIAGVEYLQTLVEGGYVKPVDYGDAKQLFLDGTEPFFMTGPWELDPIREAGLNYGVAAIPTIEGETPEPFQGGQAFFVSKFSTQASLAKTFVIDFVATPEVNYAMYEAEPRIPTMLEALDQAQSDPDTAAFIASGETGVPMPNIPEMNSVWGALGDNLLLVRQGELTADVAMKTAAEQVRTAIAG